MACLQQQLEGCQNFYLHFGPLTISLAPFFALVKPTLCGDYPTGSNNHRLISHLQASLPSNAAIFYLMISLALFPHVSPLF